MNRRLTVLFALAYYRPHVSGLTIYVQRLAEAMARRGHQVTVIASRHSPDLPLLEMIDGVQVVRVPVLGTLGKGPLMPSYPVRAARLLRRHQVLSLHLPQFEAGVIALAARLLGRPVVVTYHCDLRLPPGIVNRVAERTVAASNSVAGKLSKRIVAYTQDYADHSPFCSRFRHKCRMILPPVVIASVDAVARDRFRAALAPDGQPIVGMATRIAADKGIEYALNAIPELRRHYPTLKIVVAGERAPAIGEDAYFRRLQPLLDRYRDQVVFTGLLGAEQMPAFYASCDVLVVSSVNSTESFGLVQVEAMLCGTPVVATALPGVREPVGMTGMGEVVPPESAPAIAGAVLKVLADRSRYVKPRREIEGAFDFEQTIDAYEAVFGECLTGSGRA